MSTSQTNPSLYLGAIEKTLQQHYHGGMPLKHYTGGNIGFAGRLLKVDCGIVIWLFGSSAHVDGVSLFVGTVGCGSPYLGTAAIYPLIIKSC